MSEPSASARVAEGSNAPESVSTPVFLSRRERRAFERAQAGAQDEKQAAFAPQAQSPVTGSPTIAAPSEHAVSSTIPSSISSPPPPPHTPGHVDADPFAGLLRGSEAHGRVADVRHADARLTDARRSPDVDRAHPADLVPVSTQTGRLRLRPDELARATDSAPLPLVLPTPAAPDAEMPETDTTASRSKRRTKAARAAASVASEKGRKKASRAGRAALSRPRAGGAPATTYASIAAGASVARRRSPLSRVIAKAGVMVAAFALMATMAVPAYAQLDSQPWITTSNGRAQSLAVGAVQAGAVDTDDYAAHTTSAALDSTLGTVVAPEVQALAQQLMAAVNDGRLVGSTPDHIFEIRYLAQGRAVSGCGVDYRVLQAIAFALTQFNTVGVSDINRHCTGQIEGAGTASAHYTDGGGHAVDFFRLNGQALTGGDSNSIKLIEALDAVVPSGSNVGQEGCRSSLSLTHFNQIADTCDHVHIDFLDAKGATLLG